MVKVLFVCLGNICRSPTAEGIFRDVVRRHDLDHAIEIDSAGTGSWHIGHPPDKRAAEAAKRRGVDLSAIRARQVEPADFEKHDLILAMDRANYEDLAAMAPEDHRHKLKLFLEFAEDAHSREDKDVPDPYYGGPDGFELVLDLVEDTAERLLHHLRDNHLTHAEQT